MPEVLSISFSAEGCGAYCEEFTTHYIYDMRDGHRLRFDSLFTEAGCIAIDDTLRRKWQAAVGDQMQLINESLQTTGLSNENREWEEDALSMYRECLLERADQKPYVSDIEPLGQELRVHIARCSAHFNRNLDELNEVTVDLSYEWLRPHLRPELTILFAK